MDSRCINETDLDPKQITEIIVITDGDVQDREETLVPILTKLNQFQVQLRIIAVETNNKEPSESQCQCR